jgi:hypothetical protein
MMALGIILPSSPGLKRTNELTNMRLGSPNNG